MHISGEAAIDLHMHTTYSDGRWSAVDLLDYLALEGFSLVAITDHDLVETVPHVQQLGATRQVSVLAGVEISTQWHGQMGDVLCYGFDPHDQALQALTGRVRQAQKDNAETVYAELVRRGYEFPRRSEILKNGGELRVAGDCANLLIKHAYVSDWASASVLIRDAGYCEYKADMAETVDIVHQCGGIALIAHPGRGQVEPKDFTFYTPALLDEVLAEVPLDGLEVYHPTHSPSLIQSYLDYVQQHQLLFSAGSDSHGPPGRMPIKHPAKLCQALLERLDIQLG